MRDEDFSILVKCFFEEMFLKEIDDNQEMESLSIKDLTQLQIEANYVLKNELPFSFD